MRKALSHHWPGSPPSSKDFTSSLGNPDTASLSRSRAHSRSRLPPFGLASREHVHPSLHSVPRPHFTSAASTQARRPSPLLSRLGLHFPLPGQHHSTQL